MAVEFQILCDFSGKKSNTTFYIGKPQKGNHPIKLQSQWLSSNKSGSVPDEVQKSITDLYEMSEKNGLDFEQLCSHAFSSAGKNSQSIRGGNGFTSNRIGEEWKKYADEFIQKEQGVSNSNQINKEENSNNKTSEKIIEIQENNKSLINKKKIEDVEVQEQNDKPKIENTETETQKNESFLERNNSSRNTSAKLSVDSSKSAYGEDLDMI